MNDAPLTRFLSHLRSSLDDGALVKLTLGHPSDASSPLRRLIIRPVTIRGELRLAMVSRFQTRDETKNYPFAEGLALIESRLGSEFLSGHLLMQTGEIQLELGGKKPRLRTVRAEHSAATLEHDRSRNRWVEPGSRYLQLLEVTDSRGKVRERMGDKFRQIERFVDLLASAYRESSLAGLGRPLAMADMGSGKGYLTFAAYDYFTRVEKAAAEVTGVETRDDLTRLCNRAAEECGFAGLRFVCSPIADFPLPSLDILVALHACNTATDDALFAGIRAGAEVILTAPCCHKEARPQVNRAESSGPLHDVLRHGLFAERHAEMATDALRALLLEREGYRVKVAEFVAAEHTAKNVMLIATRRRGRLSTETAADLDRRIARLKAFYGIEHHRLEELLLERRQLEGSGTPPEALP